MITETWASNFTVSPPMPSQRPYLGAAKRNRRIPHVDALICREKHHATVCEAIGRQIFEATGVCGTVGGIRYSPLTESEKQALAFDEIAPSDDGMSYDEWEEMRALKTAALLKLTRFTSHLVNRTSSPTRNAIFGNDPIHHDHHRQAPAMGEPVASRAWMVASRM